MIVLRISWDKVKATISDKKCDVIDHGMEAAHTMLEPNAVLGEGCLIKSSLF
ncbi:hypothetical protein [Domibacillus iocasae]|uniref:hypothetical protein n=1 Tax=Domibacillus iocasae TaxID=1714016 RepID=UPI0014723C78|nr:hypothetical protein [Domibacillus iocasae]